MRKPLESITAAPRESNLLEWHYVIQGPKGSMYEGGYYHGTVTFPPTYPFKPPSIQMLTPNGRFKIQTRLCLSMSDFHPESWNPMWSVGTILMGLFSFFLEDASTHGSIVTSDSFKRRAAAESLAYNCRDKVFCELFPSLVETHEKMLLAAPPPLPQTVSPVSTSTAANGNDVNMVSWATVLAMSVAVLGLVWGLFQWGL